MTAENILIINAALTRTGNNQITSLTDGSSEAEIMAANYEEIVLEELDEYFWHFATKEKALNKLVWTSTNEWDYKYQAPSDILAIKRVFQNGLPVEYERNRDEIYTNADNANTPVYIEYVVRISEENWPPKFRSAIIKRLEALALRSLNEDYDKADTRENNAEISVRRARNRDANNKSNRRVPKSYRLTGIRRTSRGNPDA